MARQLVCLGYGYVAARLAWRLGMNWVTSGTKRAGSGESDVEIAPFSGDWTERVSFMIARADAVLVSIPPDEAGCPAFRAFADDVARRGAWLGYLSTTGVYGDRGGGWAFETDATTPRSIPAKRRALAETQWRGSGAATHVFRLPGIYGPGRSAFERLRAGEARRIVKPGLVHSRAHVDDIAAALVASIDRARPTAIYNVCDDAPSPPEIVIEEAARLIGVEPPPLVAYADARLSQEARRFYEENRRVSNALAKAELRWRPAFPSFREGLAAIASAL